MCAIYIYIYIYNNNNDNNNNDNNNNDNNSNNNNDILNDSLIYLSACLCICLFIESGEAGPAPGRSELSKGMMQYWHYYYY